VSSDDKSESSELPWSQATLADLENFEFEKPIAASTSADTFEMTDLFRVVRNAADQDTREHRVYSLLEAACSLHFDPGNPLEPFHPLCVWANGNRSAALEDFRGSEVVSLIAMIAERTGSVVLRARLSDIAWTLEKKRGAMAEMAIASYVGIVGGVEKGILKFRHDNENVALHHESCSNLRRALQIGRFTGWDRSEVKAARGVAADFFVRAANQEHPGLLIWFMSLDLDFGVTSPAELAATAERYAGSMTSNVHTTVDVWRLTARAYLTAGDSAGRYRCCVKAAEVLEAEANRIIRSSGSAMIATHLLSTAIAQLAGVPGEKDRRTKLRHQLVDAQSSISEEMGSFSEKVDIGEIVERIRGLFADLILRDQLFLFADIERSPVPEDLRTQALQAIREHPLSSLFGASHLDDEGKVIYRSGGSSLGSPDEPTVLQQIAQTDSFRRGIAVSAKIDPARRIIAEQSYLSEQALETLTRMSPFVPPDLVLTFARGFWRFFQGDFISALYTLIPVLENSIRYVLKSYGHDVTIFDDQTETQQDRTLGSLLEQMREPIERIFGGPIVADIERLFVAKPGPHMRHRLSHGLLQDGDAYSENAVYACWLIYRLCILPIVPQRNEVELL
jgi:hypothetical protein